MKKITLLISSFALCLVTNAQNFEWAKAFGGTQTDEATSITIDASGNLYTTGGFRGTVDFDPGAGTTNLSSAGSRDIFVQKLDASGNFIWAKSFGNTGPDDYPTSITVDASGNVYTTGVFTGTVDFDPGVGTTNLSSIGSTDVFIQKLDASGNFIWAKAFGSTGADYGSSITIDASGNVYTLGHFQLTVDFDPGAGTTNLSSIGSADAFIQKLDASGNFIWAKSFGSTGPDYPSSITTDASGNLYSTGRFTGTVDFDPGAGTTNLTSAGMADVFVQKLDANGNFIWVKSFGGPSNDYANSITVDASGNVYTTGSFSGTADFNPGTGIDTLTSAGGEDIFIQKMDASGNFAWAHAFGSQAVDYGSSITSDASGNIYTTGTFSQVIDFDPGVGTATTIGAGQTDVFIQKLDPSGNFIWVAAFGGTAADYGRSIILDASENVYTTGSFGGTVDFDPGVGTSNFTSNGGPDIFVHKMSQITTDINEFINDKEINIYPNPVSNTLNIASQSAFSKVNILDINGRLIKAINDNQNTINVAELISGFYFIVLLDENNKAIARQKFIKQ